MELRANDKIKERIDYGREHMTFKEKVLKKKNYRIKECSECKHPFQIGDKYFSRIQNGRRRKKVVGHLCQQCYNKKYVGR